MVVDAAAGKGHLHVVKWLYQNRWERCGREGVVEAAEHGFIEVLRFLFQYGPMPKFDWYMSNAVQSAIRGGHLEIIKLFHAQDADGFTKDTIGDAAAKGNLGMVQFLHENRSEGATTRAMDKAAENGRLDIVQYLHEHRSEGCTTKAMDTAARDESSEIVQFLHQNRSEGCTTTAMGCAAKSGNLEMVKFLHENRTEGCATWGFSAAVRNGHFDVVQFLFETRPGEFCVREAVQSARNSRQKAMKKYFEPHWPCQCPECLTSPSEESFEATGTSPPRNGNSSGIRLGRPSKGDSFGANSIKYLGWNGLTFD